MNALDILDQLERSKGKIQKAKVLDKGLHHPNFVELVTYALSFSKKFYVKKFNTPTPSDSSLDGTHKRFIDLLEVLNARTLTGNAAINAVEGLLAVCTEKEQKWYSRVLKKDLRCGISVKSANKAGFNIPVFEVMLATDGNKCKKLEEIVNAGVYVSPKLDGYRCLAIKKGNHAALYSRNGTYYTNFPQIVEALESIPGDFVLDGEIMSDDFQSMQKSAFASVRGTTVGDVKFHIFGFIPVDEWDSGTFQTNTADRIALMDKWFEKHDNDMLVRVQQVYTQIVDDIYSLESHFISEGYEGAMILPNIPYYKDRKANALMKFKRMETMDVEILDVYEGEGKNVGKMGGLVVLQDNGETCKVGSGFTDQDREDIWADPESVIGRVAEISYQELTADNIMRFPIFTRYRTDLS